MGILMSRQRGFTLVEIVVAVGIVAVLATVVIASVQEGRKKARDSQRISDLQQLQVALRVYKDANGVFPPNGCGPLVSSEWWVSPGPKSLPWYKECEEYITGIVPDFIPKLPTDPVSEFLNDRGFMYHVNPAGTEYKVIILSVEGPAYEQGKPFARCSLSCTAAYCGTSKSVSIWHDTNPGDNAGAECW